MLFGISLKDWLDSDKVKVIDSIAGAGKSSAVDRLLKDNNVRYLRCTSTNNLKRDAEERYGCDCKTIASGLFVTENYKFYARHRDVDYKTVVIDEILQASEMSFDWIESNIGEHNIIVTTDSKQMMAPEQEAEIKARFNEFISRDDVIYVNVNETKRARTDETKKIFETLYEQADNPVLIKANELCDNFSYMKYEDIGEFDSNCAYICHTNEIEDYVYKDKQLSSRCDLDVIPKGYISNKQPKNLRSYPIMSHLDATENQATAWCEIKNIGSPTRFQGSEVIQGSKLYYIVEYESVISMRELYTTITRLWDIADFRVVFIKIPGKVEMKTFKGLPIKEHRYLTIDDSGDTRRLTKEQMDSIVGDKDSETIYYDKNVVFSSKGNVLYVRDGYQLPKTFEQKKTNVSAGSIARRDGSINYSFVKEIYGLLENEDIDYIRSAHRLGARRPCRYQVDLHSAYPHILRNEKIACDGFIETTYNSEMLNFYLCESDIITNQSIITEELKDYVEANNLGTCKYLFSTPYNNGCFVGEWLYAKAYGTKESKDSIKGFHYGYYQKKFLQLSDDGSCYLIDERHKYELLMANICSHLLYYMLQLQDVLNGAYIVTDAIYFDDYDDTTVDKIKSVLPEWMDFRIIDNQTDTKLYQTYDDLKTADEVKKERDRERAKAKRANMTAEQKAKEAERKRLARAKKKAESEKDN